MLKRLGFLALCALLAACGGGGSGSSGGAITPQTPVGGQNTGTSAVIRITIPQSANGSTRRRNFVGADVNGATIAAYATGGTVPSPQAFDLSASSSLCTTSASSRSCTLTVTAPFGNDTFAVTTYDKPPVGGAMPSNANVLGTATVAATIVAGSIPAPIQIFVDGVISGIASLNPLVTLASGSGTQTQTVMFNPVDLDNAPITAGASDNYANPIAVTLTETGGSGLTQLTVNGAAVGTSTTLTQSSQTLGVTYTGGGAPGYFATVNLATAGASPVTKTFNVAPMYITSTSSMFTPFAVAFTGSGQTAALTISEAAGTNTYTATQSTGAACTSAATTGAASGVGATGSVTITSGSGVVSGLCSVVIVDSLNTTLTVAITNTQTSGSLQIGGITEYTLPAGSQGPKPIIAGPDGNLWAGETTASNLDKMSTSGSDTQYNVGTAVAGAITVASDGNLWYTQDAGSNAIWRVTTSGSITQHVLPIGGASLTALVAGPDGNLWVVDTGNGQVVQVSLQGTVLNTYPLDSTIVGAIAVGADGRLWIPDTSGIVWALTTTGSSSFYTLSNCTSPAQIASDASSTLYITCMTTNYIDAVTVGGGVTPIPLGAPDSPRGIAVGPDGNVWYTASGTSSIAQLNVSTHAVTRFTIPTTSALPWSICAGPDGRMWFTEFSGAKIGAIVP